MIAARGLARIESAPEAVTSGTLAEPVGVRVAEGEGVRERVTELMVELPAGVETEAEGVLEAAEVMEEEPEAEGLGEAEEEEGLTEDEGAADEEGELEEEGVLSEAAPPVRGNWAE